LIPIRFLDGQRAGHQTVVAVEKVLEVMVHHVEPELVEYSILYPFRYRDVTGDHCSTA
jgi:hypothetical protein